MTDAYPAAGAARHPEPPPHPAPEASGHLLVRIRFSTTGEFVRELRACGPDVEPVVRATLRWARDPAGAPAYDVSVVATYLRRVAPGVVALTELQHHAGVAWIESDGRERQPAEATARRLLAIVEEAARGAGLAVARGVYSAPSGQGSDPAWIAGADATLERPGASAAPPVSAPPARTPEGGTWS